MGTCTFLTRYTRADQNLFQTKTQTTKLSNKSGGHSWVTPTQHLSNSLIKAVILSLQERWGWGDRERTEFYVNRLSLHMDGNIRSGGKVNFLNRFGDSGEGIDGALYLCVSPWAPCIELCYNRCQINMYRINKWCQEHCVYVLQASFIQNSV